MFFVWFCLCAPVAVVASIGAAFGRSPKRVWPKTWLIRFLVEFIDNQKLDPPVEFDVNQVNIADAKGADVLPPFDRHDELDGKKWTFVAHETGQISVFHLRYDESKDPGAYAAPYYSRDFLPVLVGRVESFEKVQTSK